VLPPLSLCTHTHTHTHTHTGRAYAHASADADDEEEEEVLPLDHTFCVEAACPCTSMPEGHNFFFLVCIG
jgi:hypothetical protein